MYNQQVIGNQKLSRNLAQAKDSLDQISTSMLEERRQDRQKIANLEDALAESKVKNTQLKKDLTES